MVALHASQVCFTYPLLLYVARRSLDQMIFGSVEGNTPYLHLLIWTLLIVLTTLLIAIKVTHIELVLGISGGISCTRAPIYPAIAVAQLLPSRCIPSACCLPSRTTVMVSETSSAPMLYCTHRVNFALALLCVCVCYVCVCGIAGTTLIFILPAAIFLRISPAGPLDNWREVLMLLSGIVLLVLGVGVQFYMP